MYFSIIVTVYNVEQYLRTCIDSILLQNFKDYELIIIDDGSTDDSGKICDEYANKSNIFVHHQNNSGLSAARNTGIKMATGEYLLFVDSDDFLVGSDALYKLAIPLSNLKPDLLMYLTTEYDAAGKNVLWNHNRIEFTIDQVYSCQDIFDKIYAYNGIWVTMAQTKIIRREYLEDNSLYFKQGIYHEDDEWITRILFSDPTIVFSYEAVYGYRHRDNSIITTTNQEKLYKKACDKLDIGGEMLKSKWIKNSLSYAKYASQYFLGAVSQVNNMDSNYRNKFINYVGEHEDMFRYFRYSKSKSLLKYAIIQRVFGTKMLLRFMK